MRKQGGLDAEPRGRCMQRTGGLGCRNNSNKEEEQWAVAGGAMLHGAGQVHLGEVPSLAKQQYQAHSCRHFLPVQGPARKKLERFLPYLQRYILSKPPLPLDVEFDLQVGWGVGRAGRVQGRRLATRAGL